LGGDLLRQPADAASYEIEAIIQGNHPPDLTAQKLITRRIDLPLQWQAQKIALQF
jgi:hypothetical protein